MDSHKIDNPCLNPNTSLGIDQACISVINKYNNSIALFSYFDECKDCEDQPWAIVPPNTNTTFDISTKWPRHMYYVRDNKQWCHTTYSFVENGYYGWNISASSKCSSIYTIKEPDNPYMPILAAFIIFTIIGLVILTTKFLIKIIKGFLSRSYAATYEFNDSDLLDDDADQVEVEPMMRVTRASTRIKSIDTFRGIAVLLMIFVNNGGGQYTFFNHSPWFGLTIADLVLPWFAFIMGVTIVLSLKSELRLSVSRPRIVLKCLRRSLVLILLGLMINGQKKTTLSNLRLPGILQLLGVTYFICASIEAMFTKGPRHYYYSRFSYLQDILDSWIQWLIVLTLTGIHLCITFLLPVPGCPKGYFGAGGNEFRQNYSNCTAGAAGYIDRMIFGNHSYMKTKNLIYGKVLPYDPEGLMNTLSAVLIVHLGVQAGRILGCYYLRNCSKVLRWIAWAILTGVTAGCLCDWGYGGVIPLSKNMMTTSFVLSTSSIAFLLFAFLYYMIDGLRIWSGAPFTYAGANAIFLYVGHYLTMNQFPWGWQLVNPTHGTALAMNIWTTTLWAFIAYLLYRKDIIITV